jgi:hypothetical protein
MIQNDFNAMEKGILAWVRGHTGNAKLAVQIDSARFVRREWTLKTRMNAEK